jgi:hypothetical protein
MSVRTTSKAFAAAILLLVLGGLACNNRPQANQLQTSATSGPSSQAQSVQLAQGTPKATAPPLPSPPVTVRDLDTIAKEVVVDVGAVQATHTRGKTGPVFVFEEFHTSRVGQLRIAVMLLRLHEKYGLKTIGLEGTVQSPRPLDATWFHNAGGKDAQDAREDVAVRMLAEGEISSPEFMALVFPAIEVHGIEVSEEVSVEQPQGNPLSFYLVSIAEKLADPADLKKVETSLRDAKELEAAGKKEEAKKKNKEAFEYLLTAHPWVRERYQRLTDASSPTSLETMKQLVADIKAKGAELRLTIPDRIQQQLEKHQRFSELRDSASVTMARRVGELARTATGGPVAMVIGAAHSDHVTRLLHESDVSYALIRPDPINPDYGQMSIEQFGRKHKQQWARTSEGTLGKLLNGRFKPPVFITTATAKSAADANLACMLIARAARSGKNVPGDVRGQLTDLPGLDIDWQSFERDGNDVIFCMRLTGTDGAQKEVWARVGAVSSPQRARTIEEKLRQAIADLGGSGGKIPPRDPPGSSAAAKDEGPGDGKRNGIVISRIGPSTLAMYADSKADVVRVGGISKSE